MNAGILCLLTMFLIFVKIKSVITMKSKFFVFIFCLLCIGITVNAAEDKYIIKFKDSVRFYNADGSESQKDYLSVTADELQEYIDAGVVEYYEPDYEVVLFGQSWNQEMIHTEFPEKLACVGTDVKIAIIDSGVNSGYIDGLVLEGYNYVDKTTDVSDEQGHGTCVSYFAVSYNCGVAFDAKIVPLKCFKEGVSTNISDILDVIIDAVDVYDCDVINMSFGIKETLVPVDKTKLLAEKITYAQGKGAIVVAAVGNDYNSIINCPASLDNVIGVGAVDKNGTWASFSNYNKTVHVVAPGKNLGAYGRTGLSGTSFAAPQVSGLAAVAKSVDPDITHDEFAQLIAETAVETDADTTAGYDVYYGYGLVDGEAMVRKMLEGKAFHMSPIQKKETATRTVIFNNTSSEKMVCCICAVYDESGRMVECIPVEEKIGAYSIYSFKNTYSGGTVKYMVWKNMTSPMMAAKSK